MLDKLLARYGYKWEDLSHEERATLNSWINAAQERQLTVEKIRQHITDMKRILEIDLVNRKDPPSNLITLITYLIPIIGIMRKWYSDQKELEIKARIKNLALLETITASNEMAMRQLESAIANLAPKEVG